MDLETILLFRTKLLPSLVSLGMCSNFRGTDLTHHACWHKQKDRALILGVSGATPSTSRRTTTLAKCCCRTSQSMKSTTTAQQPSSKKTCSEAANLTSL